jgi:hypothetical protein
MTRVYSAVGKVNEVIPGRDGKVHGAVVRLSSGSGMLRHPIQLLYPLEVHCNDGTSAGADVETTGPEGPQLLENSEE